MLYLFTPNYYSNIAQHNARASQIFRNLSLQFCTYSKNKTRPVACFKLAIKPRFSSSHIIWINIQILFKYIIWHLFLNLKMKVRNENYKNVNMKKLLFFASIMIFGVQRQYAYDISNFSLKLCSQYAYNNRISSNGSELISISERSTCIIPYLN